MERNKMEMLSKEMLKNAIGYWDNRAQSIIKFKGGEFYTERKASIPYYIYRRNKTLYLMDKLDVKGKNILEIGCGTGYYCRYLKKRGGEVIGVDLSNNMLKLAKKYAKNSSLGILFLKNTAEDMGFKNESFDMILSVTVLQHNENSRLKMIVREMSRILKRGGKAIIFEDIAPKKIEVRMDKKGMIQLFRPVGEYVSIFKRYDMKLTSHVTLSSPFYASAMHPYNYIHNRVHIPPCMELIYPKICVEITKLLDKIWQTEGAGMGYFVFTKGCDEDD